jgi:hypothetical protein
VDAQLMRERIEQLSHHELTAEVMPGITARFRTTEP